METYTIDTEGDLLLVAEKCVEQLMPKEGAHLMALSGDLGAGKTAFTKALAAALKIKEAITSPTFVIMKSYPVVGHPVISKLVHIDAYRIEGADELRPLGFDALLTETGTLIVLEWPERIPSLIPHDAIPVTIAITNNQSRTLTYGT